MTNNPNTIKYNLVNIDNNIKNCIEQNNFSKKYIILQYLIKCIEFTRKNT